MRRVPHRFYSDEEDRALVEAYTRGGRSAALKALPHRSLYSIRSRASRLGVTGPIYHKPPPPQPSQAKHPTDPDYGKLPAELEEQP